MTEPPTPAHGVPTTDELLEAVAECLADELMPQASGRERYLLRVCVAALGQVRRELTLGPQHDRDHSERLARLGVADDAALAEEIRAGIGPERTAAVMAALRERVRDQVAVVSADSGRQ